MRLKKRIKFYYSKQNVYNFVTSKCIHKNYCNWVELVKFLQKIPYFCYHKHRLGISQFENWIGTTTI